MVRQRFRDYFYQDNNPFLPKYNPDLKPPAGTVPVFNNPFNNQPILPEIQAKVDVVLQDFELGGEATSVDFNVDPCNLIVRAFGGSGGLIGKFEVTIAYRNPACNAPPPPPMPPEPPHPPTEKWFNLPYTPGAICDAVFGFHIRTRFKQTQSIAGGVKYYNKTLPPFWAACGRFPAGGNEGVYSVTGHEWDYSESEDFCVDELNGFVDYIYGFTYFGDDLVATGGWVKVEFPDIYDYAYFYFPQSASENAIAINDIPWELVSSSCESPPPPAPPTFPPPPPRPRMSCCPNVEQNDQLLRLILKRIGEPQKVTIFDENLDRQGAQKADKTPESLNHFLKLAVERTEIVNRIVGIENFPITVPDTVIEPHKEGIFAKVFGFIDGNKKRKITTIAEFIAWMSEQDSAVLGEFHQVIEYQSDEKGKSKTLVLPNVAETLKEITLLVAQMAKQNNTQTEVLFKSLFEIVATRAEATKANAIIQDIQDYLDYPTKTKTASFNSTVSLPNIEVNKQGKAIATEATESHRNLLKPGKVKYVHEDWTGESSLHDQLLDLLQLASMLRAVYYQRTDK